MPKRKLVLPIYIVTILCLMGAAVFFMHTLQQTVNLSKGYILGKISDALGGKLDIKNINVRFNQLVFEGVELSRKGNHAKARIAKVDRVFVSYSFYDLIRRKIDPVESITSLTLVNPRVYLERDKQGKWNFAELIPKKSKEETKATPKLSALVYIENAEASYRSLKNPADEIKVASLNGKVDLRQYPFVALNIKGRSIGSGKGSFSATGTYNISSNNLLADLFVQHGDLAYYWSKILKLKFLDITGGYADAAIQLGLKNGNQLSYRGVINVNDGIVDYNLFNKPFKKVYGRVILDNHRISLKGLNAKLEGMPVNLNGDVVITDDTILDFDITSGRIDAAKMQRLFGYSIPVRGSGKVNLSVKGPVSDIRLNGNLAFPKAGFKDFAANNLSAAVNYRKGIVKIENTSAILAKSKASFDGFIDTRKGSKYIFRTKFSGLDISKLPLKSLPAANYTTKAKGLVGGNIVAKGSLKRLKDSTVWGKVSISKGAWRQYSSFDGQVGFAYLSGALTVDYFDLNSPYANLFAQGKVNIPKESISFDYYLRNLSFANVAKSFNYDYLAGEGKLTGSVGGTFKQPTVSGSLDAENVSYQGRMFTSLKGNFEIKDNRLNLTDVVLNKDEAYHNLSGTITLAKTPVFDLVLETRSAPVEDLIALANPKGKKLPVKIQGTANADLQISGSIKNMGMQGMLVIDDGMIQDQAINKVYAMFNWGKDGFKLEDAQVAINQSFVFMKGTMNPNLSLNLQVETPADSKFNLADLQIFKEKYKAVKGEIAFNGTLTGKVTDPVFKGNVDGKDFAINESRFDELTGEVKYEAGQFDIVKGVLTQGEGTYNLNGSVNIADQVVLDLQMKLSGGKLGQIFSALALKPDKKIDGQVDGYASLGGTLDDLNARATVQLSDGEVEGYQFQKGIADITYNDRQIIIDSFKLEQGKGLVEAKGEWKLGGDVSLKIGAKDFDAGMIAALANVKRTVKGSINMELQVTGNSAQPVINSSIDVENGKIDQTEFDKFTAMLNLEKGELKIDPVIIQKGTNKVTATGIIPVPDPWKLLAGGKLSFGDVSDTMDVGIVMKNGDLNLLSMFIPDLEWAKGLASANINLRGTLLDPQIYGEVTLQRGNIKHKLYPQAFMNLSGKAIFSGSNVVLQSFAGTTGIGSFSIDGQVGLNGFQLGDINSLTVNTSGLEIEYSMFQGLVDSQLQLEGPIYAPDISGSVAVSNTTINIPESLGGSKPNQDDQDSNNETRNVFNPKVGSDGLHLTINKDVSILQKNIDLEITGDVTLPDGEYLRNPRLEGTINTSRGELNYLNTQFQLVRGKAQFDGTGIMPYIDAEAKTVVDGVQVFLDLSGKLNLKKPEEITHKLYSIPAKSEQEIASVLTVKGRWKELFAGDIQGAMVKEVVNYINQGIRVYTRNVETAVKKAFNITDFHIEAIDNYGIDATTKTSNNAFDDIFKQTYRVTVGQQLTKNFYLSYMQTLNSEKEWKTEFNYTLKQNESQSLKTNLVFSVDQKKDYRFGLETEFKF